MPRFYFNTADGGRDSDREGTILPDVATARAEAIRFAGASLVDDPALLWSGHNFRVEVLDGNRTLLFTVIMLAVDAPAADRAA